MAQIFIIPGRPGDKLWMITNIFAILVNFYGLLVMIITLCHVANIQIAYQERLVSIKSADISSDYNSVSEFSNSHL